MATEEKKSEEDQERFLVRRTYIRRGGWGKET